MKLYNPDTFVITDVVTGTTLLTPQLSPSGEHMIYTQGGDVYLLHHLALTSTLVLTNTHNPVWADDAHLIVQSNFSGNEELYLLTLETGELIPLTDNLANDSEPTFVPAIGPHIEIFSPQKGFEVETPVQVSGFVGSRVSPPLPLTALRPL